MRTVIILAAIGSTAALLLTGPAVAAESQWPTCAMKAIQVLDDGISPADVIAAAVVEECRRAWATDKSCNPNCQAMIADGLKTQLLPEVLKFRAAKRKGQASP